MTQKEAFTNLTAVGRPSTVVLASIKAAIDLSDFVIAPVVGRSAQTVRRWRRSDEVEIPEESAMAIDDLRAIVSILLDGGFDGPTIKQFLLSRNIGLGQDRPLDGLRPEMNAFRRVLHVTECFVAGVSPEPGSALSRDDGEEFRIAPIGSPQVPNAPEPSEVGS